MSKLSFLSEVFLQINLVVLIVAIKKSHWAFNLHVFCKVSNLGSMGLPWHSKVKFRMCKKGCKWQRNWIHKVGSEKVTTTPELQHEQQTISSHWMIVWQEQLQNYQMREVLKTTEVQNCYFSFCRYKIHQLLSTSSMGKKSPKICQTQKCGFAHVVVSISTLNTQMQVCSHRAGMSKTRPDLNKPPVTWCQQH